MRRWHGIDQKRWPAVAGLVDALKPGVQGQLLPWFGQSSWVATAVTLLPEMGRQGARALCPGPAKFEMPVEQTPI